MLTLDRILLLQNVQLSSFSYKIQICFVDYLNYLNESYQNVQSSDTGLETMKQRELEETFPSVLIAASVSEQSRTCEI